MSSLEAPIRDTSLNQQNMDIARSSLQFTFTPWQAATQNFMAPNLTNMATDYARSYISDFTDKTLTPEEVKEKFGVTVDEGISADHAEIMKTRQDNENLQNLINSNVDKYASGYKAMPLAGSLVGGILDPLGIAIGAGIAATAGAAAPLVGLGALARTSATVGANIARVGGLGAISGMAEGYIDDFVSKNHAEQFGLEYTDFDSKMNIGLSTLMGGVLGGLSGKFGFKRPEVRVAKESMDSFELAKRPNTDFLRAEYDASIYGRAKEGTTTRTELTTEIRNFDRVSDVKPEGPRPMYSSHVSNDGNFSHKTQNNFGLNYGEGVIMTTNRDFAFNAAASDLDGTSGHIVEATIGDLNLVDLDTNLSPELKAAIKHEMLGTGINKNLIGGALENTTDAKSFVDAISKVAQLEGRPDLLDTLTKAMQKEGFDGYSFKHRDSFNNFVGESRDSGVYIFNSEHVKATKVDKATLPKDGPKADTAKAMNDTKDWTDSKKSNLFYDEIHDTEYDKIVPGVVDEPTAHISDMNNEITELTEEMDSLFEEVNKDLQKEFGEGRLPEDFRTFTKAAEFCARNNI